jgi:hypothetical protein
MGLGGPRRHEARREEDADPSSPPVENLTSVIDRAKAGVASSCSPDRAGPGPIDLLAEAAQ